MAIEGGFKRIWEVYWISGLSPTITTAASHGNGMPFVLEESHGQQSYNDRNA